jgi:hypothetical protein
MSLFHIVHMFAEMAELNARKRALIPVLTDMIASEGGEVTAVRSLNSRMIVSSPFPAKLIRVNRIGGRPVLLQLRCAYPSDSGSWFVHAPSVGDLQWTWKSDSSLLQPPAERPGGAGVKNTVITFPFWVGALLYILLVGVAFAVPLYFLGQRR